MPPRDRKNLPRGKLCVRRNWTIVYIRKSQRGMALWAKWENPRNKSWGACNGIKKLGDNRRTLGRPTVLCERRARELCRWESGDNLKLTSFIIKAVISGTWQRSFRHRGLTQISIVTGRSDVLGTPVNVSYSISVPYDSSRGPK